jgi:acyl-[acyl carrier protein]--UDP-N-acetylglucosamine O-acyltransferase
MTKHTFPDNHRVKAHKHKNGGGWVADSATVHKSVYIGPHAQVFGNAQVLFKARIEGCALVHGNAVVKDNAVIGGVAQVCGDATVEDNVEVWGHTVISMEAKLSEANKAKRFDHEMQRRRALIDARYKRMAAEFKALWSEAEKFSDPGVISGVLNAIEASIRMAKHDDPRFDVTRFRTACGLED